MPILEKVFIPGPVGKLEVVVHIPDVVPRAIVVVAHPLPTAGGTMENKIVTTLAKTFVELGFTTLRFNFRGVGTSSGEFDNGNGEVDDALTVTRYALNKYGDLPLILSGFSFGGYVQARAAQQLSPRQLVLIAPAVTRYAMPPVSPNTLLIHGELDEVVSLMDVIQWAHPQRLPIVVLPGAVHFFHGRLDQLKEIVRHNFMGQAL
ncbi:Hydrolase_4 domain-containing protein [Candidatus Nitrotoga sp. HW29]|uniref:alpha/beta hydrolase n=1 Tax=Candidatus Nitrotoga sp. HW29 TaxID=2886963 RepID=UPI001EF2CD3A|nr:alpha/beta fold hydrolase [Candidatus Nitrotoga sp. HW29]CAH1904365.1 Hydrolase_4 domain-containing protein [Candidatus Nitrotoga sp. HW29]